MKTLYVIFLIINLFSCKNGIDYSNLKDEDMNNENFDLYSMKIYNNYDVETFYNITREYPDGGYCAEIKIL